MVTVQLKLFSEVQPGERFIFPDNPQVGVMVRLKEPVITVNNKNGYCWHAVSEFGHLWMAEPAKHMRVTMHAWDEQEVIIISRR